MNNKLNKALKVMNVINITCGFIVTVYNAYSVLDSIKNSYKYNKKVKSRKLGLNN